MKRMMTGAAAMAVALTAGAAVAQDIKVGVLYPTSGGGAIYGGSATISRSRSSTRTAASTAGRSSRSPATAN